MDVLLFACSQSAVVDSRTNRLSLFNLLEELNTTSFPCTISGLALILVMLRTPEEPDESFVTIQSTQEGRVLSGFTIGLQFQHHLRTRVVADLNGLTAIGPGLMELTVLSPTQTIMASWKVRVNHTVGGAHPATSTPSAGPQPEAPRSIALAPAAQKERNAPRTRKKH